MHGSENCSDCVYVLDRLVTSNIFGQMPSRIKAKFELNYKRKLNITVALNVLIKVNLKL